jgi:hypothetical protein
MTTSVGFITHFLSHPVDNTSSNQVRQALGIALSISKESRSPHDYGVNLDSVRVDVLPALLVCSRPGLDAELDEHGGIILASREVLLPPSPATPF